MTSDVMASLERPARIRVMSAHLTQSPRQTKSPPRARGSLLLGNAVELRRDLLGFLTELAANLGDVAEFRIGRQRVWLLSRAQDIEHVLVTDRDNFRKPKFVRVMGRMIFGDALTTTDGAPWLAQRRAIAPAFQHKRVASYAGTMVSVAERATADWRDGEIRDLDDDLMLLTLQIAARSFLDLELARDDARAITDAMSSALAGLGQRTRFGIPTPDWLPVSHNRRMRRAMTRIDAIVFDSIARRREDQRDRGDLLSMLLELRDDDGAPLSDRRVRDELVAMLLGGNQPSALTLAWALSCLATHRDVADKLAAEHASVLGDRPVELADVSRLPFTRMVIDEVLRLYPPFFVIARDTVADTTLAGYALKRGTTVFLSPWVTQRAPTYFDDPLRFDPERWTEGLAKRLPRFAYFPFSDGPRVCVAHNFAMMQSVLVLATIARKFRFELAPGHVVKPKPAISLMFERGLRVVVRARTRR
jgi:cytochrome P450